MGSRAILILGPVIVLAIVVTAVLKTVNFDNDRLPVGNEMVGTGSRSRDALTDDHDQQPVAPAHPSPPATHPSDPGPVVVASPATQPAPPAPLVTIVAPAPVPTPPAKYDHTPHKPEIILLPEQTDLGKFLVSKVHAGIDGDEFCFAFDAKMDEIIQARTARPAPVAIHKPPANNPVPYLLDEDYQFLARYVNACMARGDKGEDITRALRAQIKYRSDSRKADLLAQPPQPVSPPVRTSRNH